MKKKLLTLLLVVSLALGFVSCGSGETKTKKLGWGETENGHYKNDFFDFEISMSPDYHFLTPQEIVDMHFIPIVDEENGEENGEETQQPIDVELIDNLEEQALVHYVYATKYDESETFEFNPYINIFSENMTGTTVYNKEDYVKNNMSYTQMIFKEAGVDIDLSPLEKPWIDDRQFAKAGMHIKYENFTMHQDMYVIIKGKYALVILIGYSTEAEKQELEGFVNSIKIK